MDKLQFLEKFGSNFLVAALVPCLTFLIICIAAFSNLLPTEWVSKIRIPVNFGEFGQFSLVVLLLGILLSLTLSSLNTFILKVLEGYVLLEHFPFLTAIQKRRARKLQKKIKQLEKRSKRIINFYNRCQDQELQKYYLNIYQQQQLKLTGLVTEYEFAFANGAKEVLPTRFGNILKAAEYYPVSRYNIDSVVMWPRLIHVIDNSYFRQFEQSLNELSFLVNCSILSLLFSFISITVGTVLIFEPISPYWFYYFLALVGVFASYIFHRASIFSVSQYGDMIRSSYDLFRFQLLRALNFKLPANINEERQLWDRICEFIKVGLSRGELDLQYENEGGKFSVTTTDNSNQLFE